MLSRIYRPVVSSANAKLSYAIRATYRRGHSAISTHSSFPATLMRINAGPAFKAFRFEQEAYKNEASMNNQLEQSSDNHENADDWMSCIALVRPTLMPNTFLMHEMIRMAAENCFDDEENGLSVERPFIFTIPKGTTLPTTLVLLRETPSQFSLQPSLHTSPEDMDNILDEFYSKYADKKDVNEWLMGHKYEDVIAAENEKEWMAR